MKNTFIISKRIFIILMILLFCNNLMAQWSDGFVDIIHPTAIKTSIVFNGELYLGGGGSGNLARIGKFDGTNYYTGFTKPSEFSNSTFVVNDFAVHNNVLYAATSVSVYRLNGNTWENIFPGQATSGAVLALESFAGTLILGGAFNTLPSTGQGGCSTCYRIGRYNATTNTLSSIPVMPNATSTSKVNVLKVNSAGDKLYVGGLFDGLQNSTGVLVANDRVNYVIYDLTFNNFPSGTITNGEVFGFEEIDGVMYRYGAFTQTTAFGSTVDVNNIYPHLTNASNANFDFGFNGTFNSYVYKSIFHNGKLYIAYYGNQVTDGTSTITANSIFQYDPVSKELKQLGSIGNEGLMNNSNYSTIHDLGVFNNHLYFFGNFNKAGGNSAITYSAKYLPLESPNLTLTSPNGNTVVYGNTLTGFVLTENSNGAVSWSVTNGTGAATYDAATNTLTPTQAGTVTLTTTTAQTATYAQGSASIVITVSPKSLTITGTTVQTTKEYNRNASVQITNAGTLDGVLAADVGQVTLTTGTASFNDFNVGTNKPITFTDFSLGGAKAGNYTLAAQPTATSGSITAKPVSITGVTVQAKNYDGTTAATINNVGTVNGLIAPDVLTVQAGTATFADANAGNNKIVNLTGFTLAGAAAVLSNYTLSAQPTALTNGIINPAPTTVTFNNTTHTYDGTAKTLTVSTTPTGVPNTVNYTPHATPTNAGTYTATVTLNSTNHIISGANTATLTINPATPVVTMSSSSSGVINGTITLTANTGGSNGTLTFERQNLTGTATLAGNQLSLTTIGTVQVRALVAATTNYNAAISDWQTITINNLLTPTLSLTGTNTVVYGNTLTGFVAGGVPAGATVTWNFTNGTGEATYNAATNTLTATKAGTGTLSFTTSQTSTHAQATATFEVTILPKTLTITGTTVQTNKEFNRTATAQITNAGTLDGVLAADVGQVTLTTGTASYNDFNVGTNKTITFTAFSLGGAKAGNYTLAAQPTATTGSITAKPVSITGVTVQAKNYDGTTAATINNAGTVNGLITPDVLTAQAGTATFADANAGNNKTVNLTGFTLAGAAGVLSNYTLSAQPQAISNGIINQATLTAVAENKSRVYGQANPTLTIQYTSFVNNETAAVLDQPIQIATTATAESNVGTYPITLTGGVDNNYAINKGNGILTITQATQTITVTTQSGTRALSNGTFTVEAAASSNLPLTVTSSNPAIASVNGNTITMHQLGEVTLTFSQAGNQNYLPATNVTRTFTIVNETRVIGLATEALVEPVIVGFPHLRLITVSNTGNAPLTINNIAHSTKVTLDDAQFTIAAGATHTVAATLVVAEEGTYTEELVFESDATSGSNTITLNGEAFLITDAEESQQTEVKVGPNPGENFINIMGKVKPDVLIKDLHERRMKRKLSKGEEKDSYILDIHDLPAGMFLLELKTVNDKSITKKIIKK
ncbi:MAG: YDG domain-containing protein [Cyclobacteriaceae bacterium]|jgi:hypothetical protein|nr:YDG domain-containing protein [Cyclobacteriaceae bacterium]